MKKFIPLLLAVFAIAFVSCEKDPDMDKLDSKYLVYTNYDTKADFKAFKTYYLPDSILVIGNSKDAEYWKDEKCTGNSQRIRCQYEQPWLCPYIQSRKRRPRFASELRKEHLLLYGLRTPRMVVELPGLLGCSLLGQLGWMVLSLCRELCLQHRFLHQRIAESGGAARPERETSRSVDQLHERLIEWLYFCQYQTGSGRCEPSFHSINLAFTQSAYLNRMSAQMRVNYRTDDR